MKTLIFPAVLAGICLLGALTPAQAQVIPDVRGVQPFTAEAQFMSLPGYLRWSYFVENNVWISRAEATALVRAQLTTPAG